LEDTSNSADPVFAFVAVVTGNDGQELFYNISDQNGTFFYSGFGSIPASSVNVSGGSLNACKVTVTLNVNTCAVARNRRWLQRKFRWLWDNVWWSGQVPGNEVTAEVRARPKMSRPILQVGELRGSTRNFELGPIRVR
jgi:hypothetical protein